MLMNDRVISAVEHWILHRHANPFKAGDEFHPHSHIYRDWIDLSALYNLKLSGTLFRLLKPALRRPYHLDREGLNAYIRKSKPHVDDDERYSFLIDCYRTIESILDRYDPQPEPRGVV